MEQIFKGLNDFCFFECCRREHFELIKWFLFDLNFINQEVVNIAQKDYKIIDKIIYIRKKQLLLGYCFGGGTDDKPLSLMSHRNFSDCLMMI